MKQRLYYLSFILLIIIAALLGKSCGTNNVITVPFDTKPVISKIKAEIEQLKILHKIDKAQADTVTKWRTKYRTIRHDSIVECETKLLVCDTLILADSLLIATKDAIINTQDTIIKGYQVLVRNDSNVIAVSGKQIRKLKRQVLLWKVVAATEAVLIGVGAVR